MLTMELYNYEEMQQAFFQLLIHKQHFNYHNSLRNRLSKFTAQQTEYLSILNVMEMNAFSFIYKAQRR